MPAYSMGTEPSALVHLFSSFDVVPVKSFTFFIRGVSRSWEESIGGWNDDESGSGSEYASNRADQIPFYHISDIVVRCTGNSWLMKHCNVDSHGWR